MKKLITTVVLLSFIMTCIGSCFVHAEIAGVLVGADGKTILSATGYISSGGTAADGGVGGAEFDNVSFQTTEWVEYALSVEQEGLYNVGIAYGAESEMSLAFSVNGTEAEKKSFAETGGYRKYQEVNAVRIYLNGGYNTLRIENTKGSFYFRTVSFELLKKIDVEKVLTDADKDVAESGFLVPRGCDSFKIKFNQSHDIESVKEGAVKLVSGETELPTELSSDGEVMTVKLKKTLDFDTEYKFIIDGIKDNYDYSETENAEVTFKTAGERVRTGTATLEVKDFTYSGRTFDINAVMMSKAGIPIEGRKTEVYGITPSGAIIETPICSVLSAENGKTELVGSLPEDSESGVYNLVLSFEYSKADIYLEMVYVTPQKDAELAEELKDAADTDAVSLFFETNQQLLGINIVEDTKGIDADYVFKYFETDKPETVEKILSKYYLYIEMEKINQAQSTDSISAVLSDSDACEILSIEKSQVDLIINNKENLVNDILALEPIYSETDFSKNIERLIEKYYAAEYGKDDILLTTEGKSVYTNQTVILSLEFTELISDLKTVSFTLTSDSESAFVNSSIKAESHFKGKLKNNGKSCEVIFASDNPTDDVKKVGEFIIANTADANNWNIKISGLAKYDVGTDYEAISQISEKTVEVAVTVNSSKPDSGAVSRPSGVNRGQGGGTGGGVVSAPTIETPQPTEPPKVEQKFEFCDLENVSWANEAIDGLLEMGVLSESEDKKFNPQNDVTRAEFVKMIVVSFGFEDENAKTDLNDVGRDSWYYPYVAAAQKQGLITGNEKGNFNANDKISRQDMAVILFRVLEKLSYGFEKSEYGEAFADDEQITIYAKDAVYSMKKLGIINGVGYNMFAPLGAATRAQAAKIIYETVKVVGA